MERLPFTLWSGGAAHELSAVDHAERRVARDGEVQPSIEHGGVPRDRHADDGERQAPASANVASGVV